MSWIAVGILAAFCVVMLLLEQRGLRTTLQLKVKGDIKRETAAWAQYGQSFVTPVAAWLVWCREPRDWRLPLLVIVPVLMTSVSVMLMKRTFGRMRPNRENAGRFTGLSFRHDNSRESFPSSHSACAFALTICLSQLWPPGLVVFWVLAIGTATLRYLLDAHFPSDVLGGCAIGSVIGFYGYELMLRVL
ncbi:MAG: phosphatase PAP2 family protein [Tepidisphaeraceae bacterium]